MPKVELVMVEVENGRLIWEASCLVESDLRVTRWGEKAGDALVRLGQIVKFEEEREDREERLMDIKRGG